MGIDDLFLQKRKYAKEAAKKTPLNSSRWLKRRVCKDLFPHNAMSRK